MGKRAAILSLLIYTAAIWSRPTADSLTTNYMHGLNTDDWLFRFNLDRRIGSRIHVQAREQLSASRVKVAHDTDKWKDQHLLNASLRYTLSNQWRLNTFCNHFVLEDRQSGFENDITTYMIGAGATLIQQKFRAPFAIGYKEDARQQQRDRGWTGSLGFDMPRVQAFEYIHQLHAQYDQDDLNSRKNRDLNIRYLVHRAFHNETHDSLLINHTNLRRDYYISPAGEIESRQEQIYEAENRLVYGISDRIRLHVQGKISVRELNIDLIEDGRNTPKRNRRDLGTSATFQISWLNRLMNGRLMYRTRNEDQQYEIAQNLTGSPWSGSSRLLTPDNQSAFSTLALVTRFRLGHSDSLFINMRYQKFKYDTPDASNYDDRDEVRYNIDLTHKHRFNRKLSLETDLAVYLHHLIYIYGQKSADNHWTRMIRMRPSVTWQPNPGLRWKQSVEVLTNYVDYDFDAGLPGIRSFIYRKFQLEDSCSVRLFPEFHLHGFYRLELDENGKLIWDQWVQQPLIERQSHTLQIMLEYALWRRLQIFPGYSLYMRKGRQIVTGLEGRKEKKLNLDFNSAGPILKILYLGKRLRLSLTAHTLKTRTLNVRQQIYTRMDFNMRWYL